MPTNYLRDTLHKNQMLMPWAKRDTISSVDAAAMLQCDKKSVHKLIDEGQIDAYQLRPGKRKSPWRVNRWSVERYIEKLKRVSGLDSGDAGRTGNAGGSRKQPQT